MKLRLYMRFPNFLFVRKTYYAPSSYIAISHLLTRPKEVIIFVGEIITTFSDVCTVNGLIFEFYTFVLIEIHLNMNSLSTNNYQRG